MQASTLSSDYLLAEDLIAAGAEAIDRCLLNPNGAGIAYERPASIFYGAHSQASTGSSLSQIDADLDNALQYMVAAGSDLLNGVWLLRPESATYLSGLRDPSGARAFPQLSVIGGYLKGLPCIVSAAMAEPGSPPSGFIGLVDGSQIALMDEGASQLAVSRDATIQLLDNPSSSSATGTPANAVSMFQTNTVAIRSTQWINWMLRRPFATLISGVTF